MKNEPLVGSSAFFVLVLNNGDQLINHTVWYCLIATAMAEILVMMLMMTWQGNPLEAPNIAPTRSSAKKNDWSYGTLKLVFDAFCNFLCISDNAKFKMTPPPKKKKKKKKKKNKKKTKKKHSFSLKVMSGITTSFGHFLLLWRGTDRMNNCSSISICICICLNKL